MKIVILSSPFGFIPPKGIGAIEKLWYDLAREFACERHDVCILAKQYDRNITSEVSDGISIKYIKGYERSSSVKIDLIGDFMFTFKALRAMSECDVMIQNSFFAPILCRWFTKKIGISVYNVARYPHGQFRFYTGVDLLASCSSMITKAVIDQCLKVKDIVKTINNPVNIDVFTPQEKKPHASVEIIYTGRIHQEKGLLNLVRSCSALADRYPIRLTLVGTWNDHQGGSGDAYRMELEECGRHLDLRFTGAVSNPIQLAMLIQNADIYCYPPLPTTGDAMPCAPLEAMATGTPVVVSDLPCFDDYVVDGENALRFNVKDNAVGNLTDAITKLIEDKPLASRLAKQGVITSQRFSNRNVAGNYLSIFKEIYNKKYGRNLL